MNFEKLLLNKDFDNFQINIIDNISKWILNPSENIIFVITGGPGVGKSKTVEEVLKHLKENTLLNEFFKIEKLGPTKKVANRINGKTIHSRLRWDFRKNSILEQISQKVYEINEIDLNETFAECIFDYIKKCFSIADMYYDRLFDVINAHTHKTSKNINTILYIDEISMIPVWQIYLIVKWFLNEKKSLFLFTGDVDQTKPVKYPYSIFDLISCHKNCSLINIKIEVFTLAINHRFNNTYSDFIINIKKYKKSDKLKDFLLGFFDNHKLYSSERLNDSQIKECDTILSYKNKNVFYYNNLKYNLLSSEEKKIKSKFLIHFINGSSCAMDLEMPKDLITAINKNFSPLDLKYSSFYELNLKINCPLVVINNIKDSSLANGDLVIFKNYDGINDVLFVEKSSIIYRIQRYNKYLNRYLIDQIKEYFKLSYISKITMSQFPVQLGYSLTIHKTQGETIKCKVCYDFDGTKKCESVNELIYTAFSRVQNFNQILGVTGLL